MFCVIMYLTLIFSIMALGERLLFRYRIYLLRREAREAADHFVEIWERKNAIVRTVE